MAGGTSRFRPASTLFNGERRSFALLRPIVDATGQDKLRDVVLEAYMEHEAEVAKLA